MGLLTILKKIKQKEKEMRILILGLDNAGKTTILKKVCGQPTDKIEPTLGFNIQTLQHMQYTLNLWDVGGQSSIRAYWRNYFEATDGVVFVVDSADTLRLELCRDTLADLLTHEPLAGATLLILANKQDVDGAASASAISELLQLQRLQRHWKVLPCSAKTGQGLMSGMDWLVQDIGSRIFMLS